MTIRKRLARSNLIMILIPVAIAAALLLGLELLRKRTVQRAGAFGPGTHSRADGAKNRERQTG